ncbi:MAG: FAD-dependent oxidoreductase [Ilumatobacteraceae bacterium]|nr:MAG: FAD-dependent oxidoreductase [Actinomycetota bacterium]
MNHDADAIVVGAGPAGASAALVLARAGLSVVLLERGPFPGSKNMYGGVVYPRVLDQLIPEWWQTAPVQRWVVRRATMLMTETQALTVDYRTNAWGKPPYNGATAYRPDFDHWLAGQAEEAGARLVCSTTVTGLLRDTSGAIVGVRTDRPGGDLRAPMVIACDGVNSFLAKEAGLYGKLDASNYTLGVKETLALPKDVIDERFGVRDSEGVDIEILGGTSGVNGGGFLYTNLDTISVGVVLKLPKLAAQDKRPEEIIARLKAHPAIKPLVEGGELKEYSAHLIPESGWSMLPDFAAPGLLVAGDAAALCFAAGIWLEGVNFAMASGMYAGQTAAEALRKGDTSLAGLAGYRERLEASFVLQDHKKLRGVPSLVLSDRVQHRYPPFVANVVERMFRVDNPDPKPGLRRIVLEERKRAGLRWRDLIRDARTAVRGFG